jgi:hypothetical protein
MTAIDTTLAAIAGLAVLLGALHLYAWWTIRNLPNEPLLAREPSQRKRPR